MTIHYSESPDDIGQADTPFIQPVSSPGDIGQFRYEWCQMTRNYKQREKRASIDRLKLGLEDFLRFVLQEEDCDVTVGFAAMLEITVQLGVTCYGKQGAVTHFQTLAADLPAMLRVVRN